MKKIGYLIVYFAMLFCLQLKAQDYLNKDSLISDFNYLIQELEATHPDPYSGFGGKVFFHKQAYDLRNELQTGNYTQQEFSTKISAFLSYLHDGHTTLYRPKVKNKNQAGLYVITAKVIPDGLIVSKVPTKDKSFLGSRILGINDVSLDSLLQIVNTMESCENKYGQYARLSTYLNQSDFILKVFPDTKDMINIDIETPDGIHKKLPIPLVSKEEWRKYPTTQLPEWESMQTNSYMAYQFLDEKKDVMLFKLSSIMARENFETTIFDNWPGAYEQMKSFYSWTLKKDMPTDTIEALKGIPSFSETFLKMLKDMEKRKSRYLIIDLRGNSGGWTPITLPSLYQLFGDNYLKTDMTTQSYRLISPLYLQKINQSLEEFNRTYNCNFKLGDYIFGQMPRDTSDITVLRDKFIENCMSDTKTELKKQQGIPVYSPKHIYVITNEKTFSAAFHYTFYLWKMGATIVGVPSMQAPNTFMEQTPFELPYTKIKGSISNSIQLFLPPDNYRANIFWPDMMPSYNDYKRYRFDEHSEIRYLLDQIK